MRSVNTRVRPRYVARRVCLGIIFRPASQRVYSRPHAQGIAVSPSSLHDWPCVCGDAVSLPFCSISNAAHEVGRSILRACLTIRRCYELAFSFPRLLLGFVSLPLGGEAWSLPGAFTYLNTDLQRSQSCDTTNETFIFVCMQARIWLSSCTYTCKYPFIASMCSACVMIPK